MSKNFGNYRGGIFPATDLYYSHNKEDRMIDSITSWADMMGIGYNWDTISTVLYVLIGCVIGYFWDRRDDNDCDY